MRYLLLIIFTLIIPAQAQDETNYFIEAEVSNLTPFVGQQVIYTFRVYSKISRTQQGELVDPAFEGFWQQEAGPVRRYATFVGTESYDVTERQVALFPAYVGEIEIEPAALIIPPGPSDAGTVLLTAPITVNVRGLPVVPDPGLFDGVVGQFEMEPTVDRQEVRLGEPVTMRLTIRGNGNIEQLSAPLLPATDGWEVFKNPSVYQVTEAEGELLGQKTFEWLLTATEPGVHMLPEIGLTYFDPAAQSYRSIHTAAVSVNVLPADGESAVPDVELPEAEPLPLKPLPASLAMGAHGTVFLLPLVLWGGPPLVTLAVWWEMRRRRLRAQNASYYRRSEALRQAQVRLAQARRSGESYRLAREALLNYFADKLGTTASTLSYLDIVRAVQEQGMRAESSGAVLAILEQIDQALYAPGDTSQNPAMIQQMSQLLEALDAGWKGS